MEKQNYGNPHVLNPVLPVFVTSQKMEGFIIQLTMLSAFSLQGIANTTISSPSQYLKTSSYKWYKEESTGLMKPGF